MNAKDAFKVGFLLKCASDGCDTIEKIQARIDATRILSKQADYGLDTIRNAISSIVPQMATAAIAAPPVIGGLAGYALANATGESYTPKDALHDEELSNLVVNSKKLEELIAQRKKREAETTSGGRTGRAFV